MADPKQPRVVRIKNRLRELFIGDDGLRRFSDLTWLQQFFHFWVLVAQSFLKNRLPVQAASLSYTTILALVPILAVALGITSSLLKGQSEEQIEDRIGGFVDRVVASLVPPAQLLDTAAVERAANTTNAPTIGLESTNAATNGLDVTNQVSDVKAINAESQASNTNRLDASEAATIEEQDEHYISARSAVAREIKGFIQNTRSGTLGLTGTAVLVFMAIAMLSRIEDAFNQIWAVSKGRSFFLRLVFYWTVISLAPLILVAGLGLAGGSHLDSAERMLEHFPLLHGLIFQFLPIFVLSICFGALYMLMPNTKVHWTAALVGGGVAALLWHLNSSLSAHFAARVVTSSKMYGSMAILPIFMVSLYLGWIILLFGGQVSHAWQNRLAYFQERISDNINQRGKEFVALRLMTSIGASFQRGDPPNSVGSLSDGLGVPPRLTQQVLQTLINSHLITEVVGAEQAYVPARPIESISCYDILHALRAGQGLDLSSKEEPLQRHVLGEFQRINDAERKAAEKISLQVMAQRANSLESGPDPVAGIISDGQG